MSRAARGIILSLAIAGSGLASSGCLLLVAGAVEADRQSHKAPPPPPTEQQPSAPASSGTAPVPPSGTVISPPASPDAGAISL